MRLNIKKILRKINYTLELPQSIKAFIINLNSIIAKIPAKIKATTKKLPNKPSKEFVLFLFYFSLSAPLSFFNLIGFICNDFINYILIRSNLNIYFTIFFLLYQSKIHQQENWQKLNLVIVRREKYFFHLSMICRLIQWPFELQQLLE